MLYDPLRKRNNILKEERVALQSLLNKEYDGKKPIGNIAQYDLEDIVSAWLVGLQPILAPDASSLKSLA